jgi:hypothetical protein
MIVDGIAYTFGVFIDNFAEHFQVGKGTVSWVGSLLSGMYLTAGKIYNLIKKLHKASDLHFLLLF